MKQLCTAVLSLFLTSCLLSNYATLDTSFAGQGFTFNSTQTPITWTDQHQTCTAVQPDGKVLVAGNAIGANSIGGEQVAIVRFNPDGSLDATFNANGTPAFTGSLEIPATPGYLTYTIPGNYNDSEYTSVESTYGIALQTDGSIILTGTALLDLGGFPYLFIVKFQSDGRLDTRFGVGGTTGITANTSGTSITSPPSGHDPLVVFGNSGSIVFPWYNTAVSYSILSQDDNKIVIAGQIANQNPAIFRFLSTGALDTVANGGSGFGSTNASSAPGYITIATPYPRGTVGSFIKSLALDINGNIYMAGQYNLNPEGAPSPDEYFPAMYQCTYQGVLNNYGTVLSTDTSPTPYGAVISTATSFIQGAFNDVVIQPDGKAVVVGTATFNDGETYSMVLARFTSDGQLDTTFGQEGLGYIVNTLSSTGVAISINENQQFLVTGAYGTSDYSVIYRYNNDGTLDLNFSATGYIAFNDIGYTNVTLGTATTSDGKIVLGATIDNQFGALKLLGNNQPQITIPQVSFYGYQHNSLSEFLYVNSYAQIITDSTAHDATVDAINNVINAYATVYLSQSNFNYILYLYLLKPSLLYTQTQLIETYSASADQINTFFTYFNARIDNLSALQG